MRLSFILCFLCSQAWQGCRTAVFLPAGTALLPEGQLQQLVPQLSVYVWIPLGTWILSHPPPPCRRNAHNDLALGFKKVGGIKEVAFVYHIACLKGSWWRRGREMLLLAAWMCGCFHWGGPGCYIDGIGIFTCSLGANDLSCLTSQ